MENSKENMHFHFRAKRDNRAFRVKAELFECMVVLMIKKERCLILD